MTMRPLLSLALLLLASLGPLHAQDNRVSKTEVTLTGQHGRSLAKLVIHEAPWSTEHDAVEARIDRLIGIEGRALGALLEYDVSLAGLDIDLEVRGRMYEAYRVAAAQLDQKLNRLREIQGEYFARLSELLPEGLPVVFEDRKTVDRVSAALRDEIIAALKQRLLDAWAAREAAVDAYLEATVRAESSGWPGIATLSRGIQGTVDLEAGGWVLEKIEAAEKERTALVASIEEVERDLDRKSKEALQLRENPPADAALFQQQLTSLQDAINALQQKLNGRAAGAEGQPAVEGLKQRKAEVEKRLAELRRQYAEERRKRQAEAAVGGEGGALVGKLMTQVSPRYIELEHARREMARASADVDILGEALQTLSAARVERAIVARRLAVRDPDVVEKIIHEDRMPALQAVHRAGCELRDAAIDAGIASLIRRAVGTEDSLLAQNEYFHALESLCSKKQLTASSKMSRGLQWTANFGRGVLDLGFGAWDGFLDNSRQIINRVSPWPFRTKTVRTMETLAVERKKARDKVQILEQARGQEKAALYAHFGLEEEEPFALSGDSVRLGAKAQPLDLLKRDRAFFDASNGGLRRIACSFDVTLFDRLESEYLIACERATLTLEGLERAQARNYGMDEDTRRWSPKVILSPARVARNLAWIYLSRGKSDDLNQHVARRTGELTLMKGMLATWKKLRFDVLALTRWENTTVLEQARKSHVELLSHPDYARFWDVAGAEREAAQRDLARVLKEEADRSGSWVDRRDHSARQEICQAIPRMPGLLAGALLEDAMDQAHQGDFGGCYASLVRANALDWSVVSTRSLRMVEDELAWMEASALAETSLIQFADQCFYAALSARLFPVGPQTPLGTLVRHPSLIWKAAKGALGSWKGLGGLASFGARQMNPLSMILNWNTLVRGELAVGMVNLSRSTAEAMTREALRDGVFCRVMDPEWADALANLITDGAAWKTQQCLQNHFLHKWATEVNEANQKLKLTQRYQDIAESTEVAYIRQQARAEMMAAVEVSALQGRVRDLTRKIQFLRATGIVTDEARADRLLHQMARAEHLVRSIRDPMTARRVNDVIAALSWGLNSDDPDTARRARTELFKRLNFDEVGRIKSRLGLFRGAGGDDPELARRVDDVRRAIVADACNEFLRVMRHDPLQAVDDAALLERLKALKPEQVSALQAAIMGLAYTGSGGKPRGREYKTLLSDLDLTLLVTDLDVNMRNLLKDIMDYCFIRVTTDRTMSSEEAPRRPWLWGDQGEPMFRGFRPEHFEVNFMVDCADLLFPKGWKATGPGGFLAGLKQHWDAHVKQTGDDSPEAFRKFHQDLADELDADIRTLENNILDPEKYVLAGRLRALSYLCGISGVLQVPDAQTMRFVLAEEANPQLQAYAKQLADQTFHRARLEKWMAIDIMLDDMRFLHKTVKKYGPPSDMSVDDLFAFTDKLDKYGIRVLLGAVTGSDDGLPELNGLLTRPGGGDHGDICDIALNLARQGKLNLTPEEQLVVREWKARKLGGRMHLILEERIGGMRIGPDDPVFHNALKAHVEQSLALVSKLLGTGLDTGCAEVAKLNAGIEEARRQPGGEHKAKVLEKQRDKILISWAAAYEKLPEAERAFVGEAFKKAGLDVGQFVKEQQAAVQDIRGGGHFVGGKMTWYQRYLEEQARRQRAAEERGEGGGR